eukprot:3786338-Alexandrium_andersonii.AAC.1
MGMHVRYTPIVQWYDHHSERFGAFASRCILMLRDIIRCMLAVKSDPLHVARRKVLVQAMPPIMLEQEGEWLARCQRGIAGVAAAGAFAVMDKYMRSFPLAWGTEGADGEHGLYVGWIELLVDFCANADAKGFFGHFFQ